MRVVVLALVFVAGCRFDLPGFCGDGEVDSDEVCDDGNARDGDGCAADCRSNETCGNGIIDPNEFCDDGNSADNDACLNTCVPALCGDGFVQVGVEDCDDGNLVTERCSYGEQSCLVCDQTCHIVAGAPSRCGDGIVQPPEEVCDDGNTDACGTCGAACLTPKPGGNCPAGTACRFNADCMSGNCLPTRICQ